MTQLVFQQKKTSELFTTSDIVAEFAGIQHHAVQVLIDKYQKDLQEFGRVSFEMRALPTNGGIQQHKIYHLNEPQAMLLLTYFKNTEQVRTFKKELVRQFFAMRQRIAELSSSVWADTRTLTKAIRQQEADSIKALVDYATEHGSKHAQFYYKNLSTLADRTAGIINRDKAGVMQLNALMTVENIIKREITNGIKAGTPYKQIYATCKNQLAQYAAVTQA